MAQPAQGATLGTCCHPVPLPMAPARDMAMCVNTPVHDCMHPTQHSWVNEDKFLKSFVSSL